MLPFHNLSSQQIIDEFATSKDKLKEIFENANLTKFLEPYKQLFSQAGINCEYFIEDEFNSKRKDHNDSRFSIFLPNIRSLNCYHKELKVYLTLLNMQFDCICLVEIWNYNIEFYKNILPGYIGHFEKAIDSNIGRVAIFIKNDLKITNRTKEFKIEFSKNVRVENLWFEVTKEKEKFLVGTIYRHPKGNVKEFTNILETTLTKITTDKKIKDCFVTGDINIDLIKFNYQIVVENYLNTMLRYAFMPTIVLPTRITNHTCTLIDHIFYYSKHFRNNLFSGNLFVDITDHFAKFLIIGPKKKKQNRPYVRIFSDKNKEKFKNSLCIIEWNEELRNKNTNQACLFSMNS